MFQYHLRSFVCLCVFMVSYREEQILSHHNTCYTRYALYKYCGFKCLLLKWKYDCTLFLYRDALLLHFKIIMDVLHPSYKFFFLKKNSKTNPMCMFTETFFLSIFRLSGFSCRRASFDIRTFSASCMRQSGLTWPNLMWII